MEGPSGSPPRSTTRLETLLSPSPFVCPRGPSSSRGFSRPSVCTRVYCGPSSGGRQGPGVPQDSPSGGTTEDFLHRNVGDVGVVDSAQDREEGFLRRVKTGEVRRRPIRGLAEARVVTVGPIHLVWGDPDPRRRDFYVFLSLSSPWPLFCGSGLYTVDIYGSSCAFWFCFFRSKCSSNLEPPIDILSSVTSSPILTFLFVFVSRGPSDGRTQILLPFPPSSIV